MSRKIIQIILGGPDLTELYALADDGTIWLKKVDPTSRGVKWLKIDTSGVES